MNVNRLSKPSNEMVIVYQIDDQDLVDFGNEDFDADSGFVPEGVDKIVITDYRYENIRHLHLLSPEITAEESERYWKNKGKINFPRVIVKGSIEDGYIELIETENVSDEDTLEISGYEFELLDIGNSLVLYCRDQKVLFSGNAFNYLERLNSNEIIPEMAQKIDKLANLDIERLYPSNRSPIKNDKVDEYRSEKIGHLIDYR